MQGIAICDHTGRRVLSSHFPSPLIASLAIDTITANPNSPIAWVPSLENDYSGSGKEGGQDEDEDEQVGQKDGWNDADDKKKGGGGFAVCMIERRGLRYIAPVIGDVDPIVPLTYLTKLHSILESYIQGPATEASLKDNFDIVLELLHETLSSSRLPNLTGESQLRELVVPPSQLLQKVASAAGLAVPSSTSANALLSSPLPWRKQGLKYSSNEIYFDLLETLSLLISPVSNTKSKILQGTLTGRITCRSRLSGTPDLNLSFGDRSAVGEEVAFHECVRYGRWKKDGVVSFVPPDGSFPLLSYTLPLVPPSPSTSTLLPLSLSPTITSGALGGTFSLTLTSLSPPSRPLTNLIVRFRVPKGAYGLTAYVSGGAWPGENGKGGGAGRWELTESENGGEVEEEVKWEIKKLCSTDRKAILEGVWNSSTQLPAPTSVSLTFSSPDSNFSGVRIGGVKMAPMAGGETYNLYKGVRLQGEGDVEVRC